MKKVNLVIKRVLLFIAILNYCSAYSQTMTVTGKVIDSATGKV